MAAEVAALAAEAREALLAKLQVEPPLPPRSPAAAEARLSWKVGARRMRIRYSSSRQTVWPAPRRGGIDRGS
jgi:hypothetical protein